MPGAAPAFFPLGCSRACRPCQRSRGLATLAIVLALMLLAAGITASSQQAMRAEGAGVSSFVHGVRAFEAAQAGLDFAFAVLNAGALDARCQPDPSPSDGSGAGRWAAQVSLGPVHALCVHGSGRWHCRCSVTAGETPAPPEKLASALLAELGGGPDRPAVSFLVRAQLEPGTTQVSLQALGCSPAGAPCLPGAAAGSSSPGSLARLTQKLEAVPGVVWPGEFVESGAVVGPTSLFARVSGSWRDF